MRRMFRYLTLFWLCVASFYTVGHAASAQLTDEQFARLTLASPAGGRPTTQSRSSSRARLRRP